MKSLILSILFGFSTRSSFLAQNCIITNFSIKSEGNGAQSSFQMSITTFSIDNVVYAQIEQIQVILILRWIIKAILPDQ